MVASYLGFKPTYRPVGEAPQHTNPAEFFAPFVRLNPSLLGQEIAMPSQVIDFDKGTVEKAA